MEQVVTLVDWRLRCPKLIAIEGNSYRLEEATERRRQGEDPQRQAQDVAALRTYHIPFHPLTTATPLCAAPSRGRLPRGSGHSGSRADRLSRACSSATGTPMGVWRCPGAAES